MSDRTLVVTMTLLVTGVPLLPMSLSWAASATLGFLTVLAWRSRRPAAAAVGVFCSVCLAVALAGVGYSQIVLGLGLISFMAIVRNNPWLRGADAWLRRGSFGVDVAVMTAASALLAAMAVWTWFRLVNPDIDDIVRDFVPDAPLGLLVAGGLAFSVVNAAVEEGAYRGVIQHGLETVLGPGAVALVLQAMAFGALHINGFPRGWMGVGLAAVYGLLMGAIRRRSGGMLAPWAAHVFTDIAIAAIVLAIAR